MKKSLSIVLSMFLLVSSLLVCLIFTTSAEAKTVVIADFDGDELGASVAYPDDGSVTVEAAATPSLEGKSLKMLLRYTDAWGQITYKIGSDTTFPADMAKKYLSFWVKSEVDCKVKVQVLGADWTDAYYVVDILEGAHMYNVDITESGYNGIRGIIINNWADVYETAPTPFSGNAYLDSIIVTDTPRADTDPEPSGPKTVDVADFDGDELGVQVAYPDDGSVTVEAVDTPSLEGKSLKMLLRYSGEYGKITYQFNSSARFLQNMEKKYFSFWMKSEVDCKIKLQLVDINWNGNAYYDVEIQEGAHMYNVDISDCTFEGFARFLILNWSEYYDTATAPAPFSGTAYLDSVVVTDTPRTYTDPDASDTSDTSDSSDASDTSDASQPDANTDVLVTDFENGQLFPKTGPYMREGIEFDIATSPVYSGSQSLKMNLNYEGDWTKIEWVMEPDGWESWPHLNSDSRYLSFWMNADVDCVLQVGLLDKDYSRDMITLVDIRKGTHFYNVDISAYTKDAVRGVVFRLSADDYEEETAAWKGTAYLDSVIFTATPRELPDEDNSTASTGSNTSTGSTTSPSTGVGIRLLPLALIGFAGAAVVMMKKKK